MIPDQQGLELAKEGIKESVKQAFAPLQDIAQRLLGPACTEIGLSLGESARVWRKQRYLRLLEKVERMTDGAAIPLGPVAPRLLFPILDAAALEDDDDLQERWAALLANAGNLDFGKNVLPSFPSVLRELSGFEALFLDRVFDEVLEDEKAKVAYIKVGNPQLPNEPVPECPLRKATFAAAAPVMLGNLQRLGLLTLRRSLPILLNGNPLSNNEDYCFLSAFGKAFVRACRPPS